VLAEYLCQITAEFPQLPKDNLEYNKNICNFASNADL